MSLPARILHLRELAGLKARELDRLAGLGQGHTRLIETGHRPRVEVETVLQLARTLGASLDWLLSGKGNPPSLRTVLTSVKAARERYDQALDDDAPAAPGSGPSVDEYDRASGE